MQSASSDALGSYKTGLNPPEFEARFFEGLGGTQSYSSAASYAYLQSQDMLSGQQAASSPPPWGFDTIHARRLEPARPGRNCPEGLVRSEAKASYDRRKQTTVLGKLMVSLYQTAIRLAEQAGSQPLDLQGH